jgi:peptide/nickel transport system substrate-binding protein
MKITAIKYFCCILVLAINTNYILSQAKLDNNFLTDTIGADFGDKLIVREMSDPESLNPIVSNDATATEICSYIFETLLNQDKVSYELIPGLADLPEISEDYLEYTFTINKDARFSDGMPLTARDVIFTLKTIKNPFVDDEALRSYYEFIEKAEIDNGDEYRVKFTVSKPGWKAIYVLSLLQIIPKHILDPDNLTDTFQWNDLSDNRSNTVNSNMKRFAEFINSHEVSTEAECLIGSGPYKFESWDYNDKIILSRNENYWNNNVPNYLSKIIFKVIGDNNAALIALKNKEIDVMYVIKPYDFYEGLKNPDRYKLIKGEPYEPAYTYLAWNQLNPLFQDKNVRWALSHLIDRNLIINEYMYGKGVKIQSHVFFQSKKLLNTDLPEIKYDPKVAKKMLEVAGWKDSDGNGILDKFLGGIKIEFKFTFLTNTNPLRSQILQRISDDLKKVGIKSEIKELEWSVYLDKIRNHDFDATYGAWTSPTTPPDPYQIWHSSQSQDDGSNFISFNNEKNDNLIESYRDEMDETKRILILKEWQKLIYEEQPYTFLWSPRARYVYDKRFKNVNWYNFQPSPAFNEWWVPKNEQKY